MASAHQTPGGYKFAPHVASQQGRANQHEPASVGLFWSSDVSFGLIYYGIFDAAAVLYGTNFWREARVSYVFFSPFTLDLRLMLAWDCLGWLHEPRVDNRRLKQKERAT